MAGQVVAVQVGGLDLLVEVVQIAGSQQTSAADRALAQLGDAFDRAQRAIEEIAVVTAATIARTAQRAARPDQVEVEFGLNVSAKGDIIVAGASGSASLKVKLVYDPGRVS